MVAYYPTQYSGIFANALEMFFDKFKLMYTGHLLRPCSLIQNYHPVINMVVLKKGFFISTQYNQFKFMGAKNGYQRANDE